MFKKYANLKDLELISESALESSLAGFWDWNVLTDEEYLSPRFKEMFGYEDHELPNCPESWQKIVFKEDLPLMYSTLQKHIDSNGEIPFISVLRYHHKEDRTVWVRCNGKVVEWTDEGKPARVIGCHVDITGEKLLEKQLKKALRDRDLLLKEVHHRVKNNLQLILSLARLKNKDGGIEVHEIEDSINSIARAYEAIYKSNKLEKISIEDYLNKIISTIIHGQNIEFKLDSIELKKSIDTLIPIGLVVTELINNSLKHAFNSSINKKINLLVTYKEGNLVFKYQDNGVGFTKEVLESSEDLESFGITIVRSLIEQLNGEVSFYNEQGAVTEIKINFIHEN